jgi:hypothetical protein
VKSVSACRASSPSTARVSVSPSAPIRPRHSAGSSPGVASVPAWSRQGASQSVLERKEPLLARPTRTARISQPAPCVSPPFLAARSAISARPTSAPPHARARDRERATWPRSAASVNNPGQAASSLLQRSRHLGRPAQGWEWDLLIPVKTKRMKRLRSHQTGARPCLSASASPTAA